MKETKPASNKANEVFKHLRQGAVVELAHRQSGKVVDYLMTESGSLH